MPERAPRAVRWLGRVLLRLYPRGFRRDHGADYREAVDHRWRLERRAGAGASWRTARVLMVDALTTVPELRRGEGEAFEVPRGWRGMVDGMGQDLRLGLRSLVRRPTFTALVVLTLALGIGAHAMLFGVLDRFLLAPMPFEDGDRIAFVTILFEESGGMGSPTQEMLERWRGGARTLEGIEVFRRGSARRPSLGGPPDVLSRLEVSPGLASFLGVEAVVGRTLGTDDARPDAPPTALLGEAFWRREFGADPGVVGRTLTLNDTTYTVAGVWPADAAIEFGEAPDVHVAIPLGQESDPSRYTRMITRLAPGVAPADADRELAALMRGVDFETTGRRSPHVALPQEFLASSFVAGLWVTWVGVVVLLGVAVVNATSLLLNRAVTRSEEIGVRRALGSSSGRLVRLFLLEGGLVALAGAAGGLVLARWGGRLLAAVAPARLPDLGGAVWSPKVVGAGLAAAGIAALVCGLVPASHLRSPELRGLMTGSSSSRRGRRIPAGGTLVAMQVGLALMLAVGAGLGFRSHRALATEDPGFDLERLAVVSILLPTSRYETPESQRAFWARALDELRSIPGVEAVTSSGVPPFSFSTMPGEPHVVGLDPVAPLGEYTAQAGAAPDYFEVMGIPVLEGRGEPAGPVEPGATVGEIVVNRAFAERYPVSVVGRELGFPSTDRTYPIVGVVGDVRAHGLADGAPRAQYYFLDAGPSGGFGRFILRAAGDPATVLASARSRIEELDPLLRPASATTGPEMLRSQTADERFLALLLLAFGAMALLVASLGVYGAVALAVSRKRRETGVRIAIGAGSPRVVRHVLGLGLRPVVAGLVLGGLATGLIAPYVRAALYEVDPVDPTSFAVGFLVLGVAAVAACLVPARRALRVDPVQTLRSE